MSAPSIVIFGTNHGALSVARHLCRRVVGAEPVASSDLLFVDRVEEKLEKARQQGYAAVCADYMDDEALKRVGIGGGVRTVFCLMSDESANVFLALSARALAPRLRIIAVSESEHSAARLRAAGANSVISPHASTARRIYSLLRKPLIVDLLEHTVFGAANLDVAEVTLPRDCALLGQRLRELDINRRFDIIPIDIIRPGDTPEPFVPGAKYRLRAGDILIVIGAAEALQAFRDSLAGMA